MVEFLLPVGLSATTTWLTYSATSWFLRRRTYALECQVADLEDLMLREIKKRAGMLSKRKLDDEDLLAQLQPKSTPAQKPWYMDFLPNTTEKGS